MGLKSTKIIKIYFLIFFSSLSIFLYLTLVAKFRPDTFLAFLQRVQQREAGPGDLAPSWSKLAPVPASLTWLCFQSIHRFYFYFLFFLFLDRLSLFHTTEMRLQTKKEIKKNLLSLISLPLARLVSLKFSSQTNFKLKMPSHHCDWLRLYSACCCFWYCGSSAAWLECLIWGLCPSTMRALECKDGTTLAPNDLFSRYNDGSKEQVIWPKPLPLMRCVHTVKSHWWRQTLSDIQQQI